MQTLAVTHFGNIIRNLALKYTGQSTMDSSKAWLWHASRTEHCNLILIILILHGAIIITVIVRVHMMNVQQHQTAAVSQFKSTYCGCKSAIIYTHQRH